MVRNGWFRRKRTVLSAPTTRASVDAAASQKGLSGRARSALSALGPALESFSVAAYGRNTAPPDGTELTSALDRSLDAVQAPANRRAVAGADADGRRKDVLELLAVTDPRQLANALRATVDEWWRTRWEDLRFSDAADAAVVFGVLLAVAVLVLVVRVTWGRGPGRTHVAMPSVVPAMYRSHLSMLRHLPVLLFVLGVPCFAMALADPLTGFTREEVSYPGRRIALLVDASTSMVMSFKSTKFKTQGESTFFSAVAGAEYFIKRRMNGPYRDLVALIQFGNQAYVVTPFTNDYENILLSVRLVSDPREWGRFSDWGTTIVEGIDQATQLFKAFNFVNASGNLMIVFTDGRDSELNRAEKPLDNLVNEARTLKIPVHMIRTAYNYRLGEVQQDKIWKAVVERTGGRFYAAYDDDSLAAALAEIDRLSPGRIDVREIQRAAPAICGLRAGRHAAVAAGGRAQTRIRRVSDVPVRTP